MVLGVVSRVLLTLLIFGFFELFSNDCSLKKSFVVFFSFDSW